MFSPAGLCVSRCAPSIFVSIAKSDLTLTHFTRRKSDLCHGIDRNLTISTIHSSLVEHFRHFRQGRQIYYSLMGRVEPRYDATMLVETIVKRRRGRRDRARRDGNGRFSPTATRCFFFRGGEAKRRKGKARIHVEVEHSISESRYFPFFLVEFLGYISV